MNKLKIGFVIDDSLDRSDGVQQYVLALGGWFSKAGHEVHYIAGESHRRDIPNLHSLGRAWSVRFNQNRLAIPRPVTNQQVATLVSKLQLDVVHIQSPFSPWLGARVISAVDDRTAVVSTFHILLSNRLAEVGLSILKKLEKRALERIDISLAVSAPAAILARRRLGLASGIMPNVVDLARFGGAVPRPGLDGKPTIVFLGRFVQRKGADYLIEAFGQMKNAEARLVLVGKGPMEKRLRQRVTQLGLESRVTFAGFIPESEKPSYLASADIAVFPATGGESFGIVLIEAMAAGAGVVIGGNNPGYASVLGQRKEVLFDPKNTQAFAELMDSLLKPAHRASLHRWQQKLIKQYDIDIVGKEVLAIYQDALRKRAKVG